MEELQKKGTTTVGIKVKDGIVLAADKRASMGYLISDSNVEKIHLIDESTAMTFAGSVADSQMLLRFLKSQIEIYRIKKGKKAGANAITTLLSHFLFGNSHSFSPFLVQFIVAGADEDSFRLFSLDMLGSKMESDKFTSTGSGSPVAYGVLEESYKPDMSLAEATKLAVHAIKAAIKRDMPTGDGIDVLVIDDKGAKKIDAKKVQTLMD